MAVADDATTVVVVSPSLQPLMVLAVIAIRAIIVVCMCFQFVHDFVLAPKHIGLNGRHFSIYSKIFVYMCIYPLATDDEGVK